MYLCIGQRVKGNAEERPLSNRPRTQAVFLFLNREGNGLG